MIGYVRQFMLVLFLVSCVVSVGRAENTETKIVDRLDTLVRPTSQSIELFTDPRDSGFTGFTTLQMNSATRTSTIRLHAQDLTIDSCFLISGKNKIPLSVKLVKDDKVDLIAANEISVSKGELKTWFHGPYNRQAVGLYKVEVDSDSYLFTQFQEKDARRAFPCFDQPEFKIPFDMTLTVPTNNLAVSNTLIRDSSMVGDFKKVRFTTTKPLPTYLIAICVGPFDEVPIPDMPVPMRVITPRGGAKLTGTAVRHTKPIFDWLENYFGISYPYDKLDFIAVPEFWAGAMENAGAITYRESALLLDTTRATKSQLRYFLLTHAHEIAHQWFGDLVTMKWWDDLWLNESFAEWMASECIEPMYPEMEIAKDRIDEIESPRRGDMAPQSLPIRPKSVSDDNLLSNLGSIYNKGMAILSMFQDYVGKENFRKGIQSYLRKYSFKNAVAEDLWAELSKASGQDMTRIMGPWITQSGLPQIRIDSTANGLVYLSQQPARHAYVDWSGQEKSSTEKLWSTPVTIYYDSASTRVSRTVLLDQQSRTATLPGYQKNSWLYPMTVGHGYYRWSLCSPVAQSLLSAADRLTPNERIEWLFNLRAEFISGTLEGGEYLHQLTQFLNDPDVGVAAAAVERVSSALGELFERPTQDSIATWLRGKVVGLRDKVGIYPKPGESAEIGFLRPSLVEFLHTDAKDSVTTKELYTIGENYFTTGKAAYPSLTSRGLNVYLAKSQLFDSCIARFERASNPQERNRYLGSLSDFESRAFADRALAYSLTSNVRPQEIFSIVFGFGGVDWLPEDYALDWVIEHFDELRKRVPPNSLDNPIGLAGGCSSERFAKVAEFYRSKTDLSDYILPALKRTEARINTCTRLRASQSKSAYDWLVAQGAFAN